MNASTKRIPILVSYLCLLFGVPNTLAQELEPNEERIAQRVLHIVRNEELQQTVENLEKELAALKEILGSIHADELRRAVESTQEVIKGDEKGKYFLDLVNMLKLEEFRDQVIKIGQAKLQFDVPSGSSGIDVLVNGTKWNIQPGKSFVWVPLGTVVLHIPKPGLKPEVYTPDKTHVTWTGEELTVTSERINAFIRNGQQPSSGPENATPAAPTGGN